jgi:hypothetical protein
VLRLQLTPSRSSDKAGHTAFESAASVQRRGRRFFRFSDFILVPLSDVIASAPLSRLDRIFWPISHCGAERNTAAMLRSALGILEAVKEPVSRFMFKCTCGPVLKAKRKVGEKPRLGWQITAKGKALLTYARRNQTAQ